MRIALFCATICALAAGCAKSSGPSASAGTTPPEVAADCSVQLPPGADNMAIAQSFNQYRLRCRPSESELEKQIAKFLDVSI